MTHEGHSGTGPLQLRGWSASCRNDRAGELRPITDDERQSCTGIAANRRVHAHRDPACAGHGPPPRQPWRTRNGEGRRCGEPPAPGATASRHTAILPERRGCPNKDALSSAT